MKKITLVLLVLIISVFTFVLTRDTTQSQKVEAQESDDEPTVVTRGNLSKKDKDYSKEYKKLYSDQNQKIGEAIKYAKQRNAKEVTAKSLGIPLIPTVGMPLTSTEVLRNLSCKADAVVLGSVKGKAAHLTEDETWIYTEYEFLVDEVVKNNNDSPIESNSSIEITRPGGVIKLDNTVVRVNDRMYDQLKKNKTYLLFLKYLPSTQGYLVSDAKGDFILQGNRLQSLSKIGIHKDLDNVDNYKVLLNDIRGLSLESCSQETNGGI